MSRFLELLLAAILNLFGAEFVAVDMENIDILVGCYYSLKILSLKLFFPEQKVCFADATSNLLIWVYAYTLRVLKFEVWSFIYS